MTSTTGMEEGIIKQDSRGRMITTPERRESLLAEFERSAMTGRKFAKWAGIKYSTFSNWVQVRRKLRGQKLSAPGVENTPSPHWLEAVVSTTTDKKATVKAPTGVLIVEGPGGVRLELSEEKQVVWAGRLLREWLGQPGC